MASSSPAARMVRAAALLFGGLGAYHLGVRPRLLRWGTDEGEVRQAFPGDARIADPFLVSTRAASVAAKPRDIWPWLVQMGDGRGGLYSLDRLDMLFGYLHSPSANVVLPQYQDLAVGDVIPLGRGPDWPVTIVDREHALVVEPAGAEITWCWRILPTAEGSARLVSRVRLRLGTRWLLWLLAPAIDLPWFVMERQMLRGIARRAEGLARSRAEKAASPPAQLTQGVEAELRARMAEVKAPAVVVAVVSSDRVIWRDATGTAKPSIEAPADAETAFLWFSMTKIATATAVMQLVDSGALAIDGRAREHLPDLEDLDPRITVRQLLNHSSGIGNPLPLRWIHRASEPGPDPREMVVRLLARYGKPKFDPGDHSAYSNIGYLVLGELIAAVSGISYKRYVVDRVLQPIGATSTGFTFAEAGTEHESEGTHPRHDPTFPFIRLLVPRWSIGPKVAKWCLFTPFYLDGSAYGGLVGPVGDAALLAAAHLGGGQVNGKRILSSDSAAEMQRIVTPGKKFDLGLGWFRLHKDSNKGNRHIEHLGGGGGFGTVMRLYPDKALGVVAMANVSSQRFSYRELLVPIERGS